MILENDLFRGINRHRIHRYLCLLSEKYNEHLQKRQKLNDIIKRIDILKKYSGDKKEISDALKHVERKLINDFYSDSSDDIDQHKNRIDNNSIQILLKKIKELTDKVESQPKKRKKTASGDAGSKKTKKKKGKPEQKKSKKKKKRKKTGSRAKRKPRKKSKEGSDFLKAEKEINDLIIKDQREKLRAKDSENSAGEDELSAVLKRINKLKEDDILS